MGSEPNWHQIWKKTRYIPKFSNFYIKKRISMLTGSKLPSLALSVYFPDKNITQRKEPIELNSEGFEIWK